MSTIQNKIDKLRSEWRELHLLEDKNSLEIRCKKRKLRYEILKLMASSKYKRVQNPKAGRVVRISPDTWAIVKKEIKDHESITDAIERLIKK